MKAVDLFAGWGGFTIAAEQAGVDVVWAANHWPLAVRAHALNHPSAVHVCQDLNQADWTKLPRYDLLLAGPSCKGGSSAGQPGRKHSSRVRRQHDAYRSSAWAVVECAFETEPRAIIVENVPEFLRYPFLDEWCSCLRKLGYRLSVLKVRCSYHGVPQRRDRIFVIGLRSDKLVELQPADEELPFGPCIDWDAEAPWTRVRDATDNVKARIAKGRRNHGRRFLTQHVTGHPGVGLSEPIRTITTKDQWAVVDGDRYRPLTIRENARGMGFPDDYTWPDDVRRRDCITGLGNAVPPPVARQLIERVAEAA